MKTIIFDIDGTIFDTKKGIINCLNDVLNCHGYLNILPSNEDKYIGPSVRDSFINFNGFSMEEANAATKEYRTKYVEKYISQSDPYPGLFEVLKVIKDKKYNLCIATMKTRRQVDKLLEIYKLSELFDQVETAKEEGGYTKTDMLNSIKRRYTDSEYFFIGDTNGDYKAALNANIEFIYATYGYGNIKYDGLIINNLDELLKYL